jgi:hypothetical protein
VDKAIYDELVWYTYWIFVVFLISKNTRLYSMIHLVGYGIVYCFNIHQYQDWLVTVYVVSLAL